MSPTVADGTGRDPAVRNGPPPAQPRPRPYIDSRAYPGPRPSRYGLVVDLPDPETEALLARIAGPPEEDEPPAHG